MNVSFVVINVIALAQVGYILLTAPPEIPLYFARPWGESQLASKWEVLILLGIINLISFLTQRFNTKTFPDEPVFHTISQTFALFLQIVVLLILSKVILSIW